MIELSAWAREQGDRYGPKPWMMLGKGPTFARRADHDLTEFNLLSLNHSVREVHVDVAHIIDIDVVHDCEDVLFDQCDYLVMPRYPHAQAAPGLARLEDYFPASPALRRLDDEGRLVWYNISTARELIEGSPVVRTRYFGSEAALGVLGVVGADSVRSLGVDGGTGYASAFGRDASLTHLANGQPSFDMQFSELRSIARDHNIDYRPMHEPFRIFVGTSPAEMVPFRVLAHSIHRNSSIPVVVEPLTSVKSPMPEHRDNRPRTNFSFARFHIPHLTGNRGRAAYFDSDMLVFGDVAELAEYPLDGAWLGCTSQNPPAKWKDNPAFKPGRQFSVMLLDCARLGWDIDDIVGQLDRRELTYQDLMFNMAIVPDQQIDDELPPSWNSLEHIDDSTKLVHYTVVPTQPWASHKNPLEKPWLDAFAAAVADRAVPRVEVERLVTAGGRKDLLTIFDQASPSTGPTYRNVAEVALGAAQLELSCLREKQLRRRLWRASRFVMLKSGSFTDATAIGRRLASAARKALG